ncbi:MAG: hypothetical protein KKA79_02735 [Nanoarchaeota archaeon]|nr:hypothetical protein [Nanoarchaeota archaeon]MCG2718646.1 hypothetical protein [Nanoarchaeota archaeon]
MNKNIYLLIFLALFLIPIVSADVMEGVADVLGIIFDETDEDLIFVKAGLWMVLFFLIFKGSEKIFPGNKGGPLIIAFVIAIIGTRYMPQEYLDYIAGGYTYLFAFIFFLIPFFLGSVFGDMLKFGKGAKTVLIIALYAAFAYGITQWTGMPLGDEASNIVYEVLDWVNENTEATWVIVAVICGLLLWMATKSRFGGGPSEPTSPFVRKLVTFLVGTSIIIALLYFFEYSLPQFIAIAIIALFIIYVLFRSTTPAPQGMRGPGFFSGLGRGARGAWGLAKGRAQPHLDKTKAWAAKKKLRFKRQATLKIGSMRQERQLIKQRNKIIAQLRKFPGGKALQTPAYKNLRAQEIQLRNKINQLKRRLGKTDFV